MRENLVEALTVKERVVSDEADHFLICFYSKLSALNADLLSLSQEIIPRLGYSVHIGRPCIDPLLVLKLHGGLSGINPVMDGLLIDVSEGNLGKVGINRVL